VSGTSGVNGRASYFCQQCGAENPAEARFCEQCGQPLTHHAGPTPTGAESAMQGTRPLIPTTAVQDQDEVWSPPPPRPVSPSAPRGESPAAPAWAAYTPPMAGAAEAAAPLAPVAPARRHRLAGCVMALVAFVLICALVAVFGWLIGGRAFVRDRARTELSNAAATQVQALGPLTVPSGTLTVTADEINAELRANAASYQPLSDPRVSITPDQIAIHFKLSRFGLGGLDSTYTGGLVARAGRLVVVNPAVSGPAGQVLAAGDAATIIEQQLNGLLTQSGLRATGVQLRDGALSIATEPLSGR